MPTVIKSLTADLSAGPGDNLFPFIAKSDLLLGYDFSDFAQWKQGLVGGQVATSYLQDYTAHTTTASNAGYDQTLNGMGVRIKDTGYVTLGYSMPSFSNASGAGHTFMVLAGAPPSTPAGWLKMMAMGWDFGSAGIVLGEQWTGTPARLIGAGVQSVNYAPAVIVTETGVGQANLIVLRATGGAAWDLKVPNLLATYSGTDTSLGVSSPVAGLPALVHLGNDLNNNTLAAHEFNIYACAIWNRALTDAEIAQQYQRLKLKFRGILN